ncbi:histidine kinase [Salmonella enterica subsp. enterica serovar Heidelberg]|nr:histidine kinase [Salmonella enterica subsp. enterica serovar Heidelberg]
MKWVKPQSLYLQLLLFLGLPLILLWGLSAFNSYVNALQAATQAYDRTLLSSARTVSERLVVRNNHLEVNVPWVVLDSFELNMNDRLYYKVVDPSGKVISGYDDLPAMPPATPRTRLYPALAWFYHTEYRGEAIRVARLLQPVNEGGIIGMAEIYVAETLQSRRYLAGQLLFSSWISQGLLVLLTLVLVGWLLRRILRPMRQLSSLMVRREPEIPVIWLFEQTLTVGAEWNRDELNDPSSTSLTVKDSNIAGISGSAANRSSKNKSEISALYVEDNIEPMAGTNIIPGLRFDYLSESGSNFSPSLNLSQELGEYVKVKAGIARAFKAPNLYQTSEGYLLYSKGNGCPKDITSGGCYLVGNKNLDPEISINKEIGLEFTVDDYHASVTYFRNDYQNKIVAGDKIIGRSASGAYVLQWQNGGKALIEGIEASMTVPLMPDRLNWNTNATYMIASEQKDTGNPLSIIPKYTVNTFLDWTITSALSANVNWTLYGKQKPRTHAESRSEETKGLSGKALGAYSLVGANVNYDINKNLRLNVGISNIFDKQIYRSAEGANTYNEPGRAYYAGVTASF